MNQVPDITHEQLAKYREAAESVWMVEGRTHWMNMSGFDNYFAGYLRHCQETEQAIKDARKQALEDAIKAVKSAVHLPISIALIEEILK